MHALLTCGVRLAAALPAALLLSAAIPLLAADDAPRADTTGMRATNEEPFEPIAAVLTHPRCLNCHTRTDFPKQGDDRHPHKLRVQRGPDNHGAVGMQCATCHQTVNNTASGVPGAPNWHLAPLSMAWENLSPAQLCRVLKDPAKNGGRTVPQLVEHMTGDALVQWAWNPGGQRTLPPVGQQAFHAAVRDWARNGATCPVDASVR